MDFDLFRNINAIEENKKVLEFLNKFSINKLKKLAIRDLNKNGRTSFRYDTGSRINDGFILLIDTPLIRFGKMELVQA